MQEKNTIFFYKIAIAYQKEWFRLFF